MSGRHMLAFGLPDAFLGMAGPVAGAGLKSWIRGPGWVPTRILDYWPEPDPNPKLINLFAINVAMNLLFSYVRLMFSGPHFSACVAVATDIILANVSPQVTSELASDGVSWVATVKKPTCLLGSPW